MPRIVTRRLGTWTLARFGGNFADLAAPSGKVVQVAGNLGGPPRLEGGGPPKSFFSFIFFSFFVFFLGKSKKKQKKKRFLTPPPPRSPQPGPGVGQPGGWTPQPRSQGRVSEEVGPPLLGMSGPAECAGLFPLSPALFPLVLAFLVAIACWFHCFPGFLLVYCFFCFFKSFFFLALKKTGLQELACIADNIILVISYHSYRWEAAVWSGGLRPCRHLFSDSRGWFVKMFPDPIYIEPAWIPYHRLESSKII